jgi:PAS domain S-box-containing protein
MIPTALGNVAALLREIPFAACYTNSSHEFVGVNDAFCRIYRLSAHELIGKTPWVIAAGDFSEELAKEIRKTVTETGWWSGPVSNRRSDGRRLGLHLFALRLGWRKQHATAGDLRLGIAVKEEERDTLLRFSMNLNAVLLGAQQPDVSDSLTRREREVRGLAAAGMKSKEIAALLDISDSTVRVHLAALRRATTARVGVRSRRATG